MGFGARAHVCSWYLIAAIAAFGMLSRCRLQSPYFVVWNTPWLLKHMEGKAASDMEDGRVERRRGVGKKGNRGASQGKMSLVIVSTQTLQGWLSARAPGQEHGEQPGVKHKWMLYEQFIWTFFFLPQIIEKCMGQIWALSGHKPYENQSLFLFLDQ